MDGLLRDLAAPSRLASVNAAEVVDVLTRIYALPSDDVLATMAILESGGLEIIAADRAIGLLAGELHARHYDRKASPLSMADCVALATAIVMGEPLATSDAPLAMAARAERVAIVPLPDSEGRRPKA